MAASASASASGPGNKKDAAEHGLFMGLGGGADCVNAFLVQMIMSSVYEARNVPGTAATLGSIRPVPADKGWDNKVSLAHPEFACMLTPESSLSAEHAKSGRYPEPHMCRLAGTETKYWSGQLAYVGRGWACEKDPSITDYSVGFDDVVKHTKATAIYVADGGGDSFIFKKGDGISTSETSDPEMGGDASAMRALYKWGSSSDEARGTPIFHVITALGLDMNVQRFELYKKTLEERGGYFGAYNTFTGEYVDWKLGDSKDTADFVENYRRVAQDVLVMDPKDKGRPGKVASKTAHVTLRASLGQTGRFITGVGWEEEGGTEVLASHAWVYFFDFRKVMELKANPV